MKPAFAIALSIALAAPALAGTPTNEETCYLGKLLDAVAMNGAAATRTFSILSSNTNPQACLPRKYAQLVLTASFTRVNTGTHTYTCTVSGSGQSTAALATYAPTTCTEGAGTCTLSWGGVFVTPSMAASKDYAFRFGHRGYPNVKCVVEQSGAPGAGDVLTVYGELVSE